MQARHSSFTPYKSYVPYLFLAPFVLLFIAFNLFPTLFSVFLSFTNWDGVSDMAMVGLSNFRQALTRDRMFIKAVFNSIVMCGLVSMPITLLISGFCSYVYYFKLKRLKKTFQITILLPYFMTTVAVGVLFSLLFDKNIGIVNNTLAALGIIDIQKPIPWLGDVALSRVVVILLNQWTFVGYTTIFFISGLTAIPEEVLESAYLDGAKPFVAFVRICLPMMSRVTYFLIITSFIGALQQMQQQLMLYNGPFSQGLPTGGPDGAVMTMGLYYYAVSFISPQYLGYGSTLSVLTFFISIIISLVLNRLLPKREI